MLGSMLESLCAHMASLSLTELMQTLRACFKVLSKIQMPVSYMEMNVDLQTQDVKRSKVRFFFVVRNVSFL